MVLFRFLEHQNTRQFTKILHLLGDFASQTLYRVPKPLLGLNSGPQWRTSVPQTPCPHCRNPKYATFHRLSDRRTVRITVAHHEARYKFGIIA